MLSAADAALITTPPDFRPYDTLETYLGRLGLLTRGFKFSELVKRGSARHMSVPKDMWKNTVAPLVLAAELRARMMAQVGAHGLRVAGFYRPGDAGAADHSLHKTASAIDLDLLRVDHHLAGMYTRIAAELWRELEDLPVGCGTYAPEGVLRTRRVHLDFGYRFRCWQGTGRTTKGTNTWSKKPAVLRLAPRVKPHPLGDVEIAAAAVREVEIAEAIKRLNESAKSTPVVVLVADPPMD